MVPYPRLARFNYLQRPKTPLVCILRRNQGGGGVVKQPALNMYRTKSKNLNSWGGGKLGQRTCRPHHSPGLISGFSGGKKKSQNKNFDDHITTI